jgi:beta-glucosidase
MASRIDKLVGELTLDEKASLTAGLDLWHTAPVERLGIPSWRLSDGPSGARGTEFEGGTGSTVIPCGSALGSTWNPALVEELGAVVGLQARSKGARVLLAPTVNLHRSPLGGRTFESYSEDPLLSGQLAAAFVRGVQSQGVACTVKHFAGNEAEFERHTIDSVIDERALRELYLVPFELAVREGGALGIMTAYNRLNGTPCGEHAGLLATVLRDEWGFEGFVVTDWYAITDAVRSPTAGLDLEMPGPARHLGARLADAVRNQTLDESVLDTQVRHLLEVFDRLGALDDPADPGPETALDLPEDRALVRRAAAESTVLLRNDGVLPFDMATVRSLAVIGPNADRGRIVGGGSASVVPHHRTSPLDAIRRRLGDDVAVTFEPGCSIDKTVPPLWAPIDLVVRAGGEDVRRETRDRTHLVFFGPPAPGIDGAWSVHARTTFVPAVDGAHEISLVQAGEARVFVDGALVVDGVTDPPPRGSSFFGAGSEERIVTIDLAAGRRTELEIELDNPRGQMLAGVTVGVRAQPTTDMIDRAVAAAAAADAVVLVIGTNDDWETEGVDRTSMDLPGEQDELVRRVCAANPRTAVIVNAGSPVTLPWADDAPALLDIWFGGQEMADALVDVVTGAAEPGGRLATSFPERVEHTAAFGNFPGEHGEVRYGESLLMGYRWHDARHLPARFPFGHGLSYTTFAIGEPDIVDHDDRTIVRVPVTNTGTRAGSEVVQLYVEPVAPRVQRPPKELKAFGKVWLEPGESTVVDLHLDERAFTYWHPDDTSAQFRARAAASTPFSPGTVDDDRPAGWRIAPGDYRLHVGRSSVDIAHTVIVPR